jgi:hypothetical protein
MNTPRLLAFVAALALTLCVAGTAWHVWGSAATPTDGHTAAPTETDTDAGCAQRCLQLGGVGTEPPTLDVTVSPRGFPTPSPIRRPRSR